MTNKCRVTSANSTGHTVKLDNKGYLSKDIVKYVVRSNKNKKITGLQRHCYRADYRSTKIQIAPDKGRFLVFSSITKDIAVATRLRGAYNSLE